MKYSKPGVCGKFSENQQKKSSVAIRLPSREIGIMEIHAVQNRDFNVCGTVHCDQVRSEHVVSAVDLVLEQFQSDLARLTGYDWV